MEKALGSGNCYDRLIELVKILRSDGGCPWDQKQTPESIKLYLLEEVYELLHAVELGAPGKICEELGDVLFHIVFLARIFEESNAFNIEGVIEGITEKMVRRHPHVFGQVNDVSTVDDVKSQWHEIKTEEAKSNSVNADSSFLDSVPKKLPALMRAYRLGERASKFGFDWPDAEGVLKKVEEEFCELKDVLDKGGQDRLAEEFGDLLFSIVNLSRFIKVHPETALSKAISKFITRFKFVEKTLSKQGRSLESASLEEMDKLWEECKKMEVEKSE